MGEFHTKRHKIYFILALTPVETCTHTFGVSLAIAVIDFPSYENAHNSDHLEKIEEKSSLKQEDPVQTRK